MKILKQLILCLISITVIHNATASEDNIVITQSEVTASVKGQDVGAAYMTIENHSKKTIKLIGVTSNVSKSVELHSMSMKNNISSMMEEKSFVIPAGGKLDFHSSHMHLMLIGLKQQLLEGNSVTLNLQFDDHKEIKITAPIKAIRVDETMPHSMGNMKMN